MCGLVDSKTLKPGDLIGVHKDSYLVLDTLPIEYGTAAWIARAAAAAPAAAASHYSIFWKFHFFYFH